VEFAMQGSVKLVVDKIFSLDQIMCVTLLIKIRATPATQISTSAEQELCPLTAEALHNSGMGLAGRRMNMPRTSRGGERLWSRSPKRTEVKWL
jgi:hypothetical protein